MFSEIGSLIFLTESKVKLILHPYVCPSAVFTATISLVSAGFSTTAVSTTAVTGAYADADAEADADAGA